MKTTIATMFLSICALFSAVAFGAEPLIKVATCNDGKEYYAPTNDHRFACAGHKGVAKWEDGSPMRAKKAAGTRVYK